MINRQTLELLHKFKDISLFSKYKAILIGGTALAYHLSHRESFDLDICFPFVDKLPDLSFLAEFEEVIPIKFEQDIIDATINDGGNIDELIQRFIIDGVKVDFFINPSSNILESQILKNDSTHILKFLRIASVQTIFELKSLLLLERNKIRDLYDIVYLLKYQNFTGREFVETIVKYKITYLPSDIISLIEAKVEDPFDIEGIEKPTMDITNYDKLKKYLLKEIKFFYH